MPSLSRSRYLLVSYLSLGLTNYFSVFTIRRDLQDLNLSLAQISMYLSVLYVPWTLKPFFGFISDRFGFRGLHRKPYAIVCNLIAAVLSFVMLAKLDVAAYVGLLSFLQVFACWSDVVYDAMLVEDTKRELPADKGRLQTRMWKMRATGLSLAYFFGAVIYEHGNSEAIFAIQGTLYLTQAIVSILVQEPRREKSPQDRVATARELRSDGLAKHSQATFEREDQDNQVLTCGTQLRAVWDCLTHPVLGRILVFNFFRGLTPSPGVPIFFFLLDRLNFTPTMIGTIGLLGEVTRLMGIFTYDRCLRWANVRSVVVCTAAMIVLLQVTGLFLVLRIHELFGLPAFAVAAFEELSTDFVSEIGNLPILFVTSVLCTKNIEGTVYATNLAIQNLAGILNGFISAGVMHAYSVDHGSFEGLPALIVFCLTLEMCVPLFGFMLPNETVETIAIEHSQTQKDERPEVNFISQQETTGNSQQKVF